MIKVRRAYPIEGVVIFFYNENTGMVISARSAGWPALCRPLIGKCYLEKTDLMLYERGPSSLIDWLIESNSGCNQLSKVTGPARDLRERCEDRNV